MKYVKGMMIVALAMVLTISGQAFAGRGQGQKVGAGVAATGTCPNGGTGMMAGSGVNIFENAPAITITGKVSNAAYYGQGLEIDNGTEVVTVYGIGPVWYWNSLEIERPVIGDDVTIEGYEVTFSDGSVKNIAVTITISGETPQTIELRNTDTGAPLWRKSMGRGFKNCPYGSAAGSGMVNGVCPYAQPVPSTDTTE
jgi:hypothetical protein